jgi:hypothetical protein
MAMSEEKPVAALCGYGKITHSTPQVVDKIKVKKKITVYLAHWFLEFLRHLACW